MHMFVIIDTLKKKKIKKYCMNKLHDCFVTKQDIINDFHWNKFNIYLWNIQRYLICISTTLSANIYNFYREYQRLLNFCFLNNYISEKKKKKKKKSIWEFELISVNFQLHLKKSHDPNDKHFKNVLKYESEYIKAAFQGKI